MEIVKEITADLLAHASGLRNKESHSDIAVLSVA